MKPILIFFSLCIIGLFSGQLWGQSAASLLREMDGLMSAPQDKQAKVKMILRDKSGKEKIREAVLKQKGPYKKIYRYTYPEKQVGIATLTLPGDIIWLYMPAFKKAVKVTLLSKSQAFTGTDFSYEDMSGSSYFDRYTPKILNENDQTYHIELMPKSMKSKYSKIILTLDKTHYYPHKMEYFDDNKEYLKHAEYHYKQKDGYWYAEKVVMTNTSKQHSTTIFLSDIKFDQGLSDDLFTVDNLSPKN